MCACVYCVLCGIPWLFVVGVFIYIAAVYCQSDHFACYWIPWNLFSRHGWGWVEHTHKKAQQTQQNTPESGTNCAKSNTNQKQWIGGVCAASARARHSSLCRTYTIRSFLLVTFVLFSVAYSWSDWLSLLLFLRAGILSIIILCNIFLYNFVLFSAATRQFGYYIFVFSIACFYRGRPVAPGSSALANAAAYFLWSFWRANPPLHFRHQIR